MANSNSNEEEDRRISVGEISGASSIENLGWDLYNDNRDETNESSIMNENIEEPPRVSNVSSSTFSFSGGEDLGWDLYVDDDDGGDDDDEKIREPPTSGGIEVMDDDDDEPRPLCYTHDNDVETGEGKKKMAGIEYNDSDDDDLPLPYDGALLHEKMAGGVEVLDNDDDNDMPLPHGEFLSHDTSIEKEDRPPAKNPHWDRITTQASTGSTSLINISRLHQLGATLIEDNGLTPSDDIETDTKAEAEEEESAAPTSEDTSLLGSARTFIQQIFTTPNINTNDNMEVNNDNGVDDEQSGLYEVEAYLVEENQPINASVQLQQNEAPAAYAEPLIIVPWWKQRKTKLLMVLVVVLVLSVAVAAIVSSPKEANAGEGTTENPPWELDDDELTATPKPTNEPSMQQVVTTPNPTRPIVVASTPPPMNKPITPSPTKGTVTTPSPTKPPQVTLQCSDYTNFKQCRRADCKWNGSICINDDPSSLVPEPSSKQPMNKPGTTAIPTTSRPTMSSPTTAIPTTSSPTTAQPSRKPSDKPSTILPTQPMEKVVSLPVNITTQSAFDMDGNNMVLAHFYDGSRTVHVDFYSLEESSWKFKQRITKIYEESNNKVKVAISGETAIVSLPWGLRNDFVFRMDDTLRWQSSSGFPAVPWTSTQMGLTIGIDGNLAVNTGQDIITPRVYVYRQVGDRFIDTALINPAALVIMKSMVKGNTLAFLVDDDIMFAWTRAIHIYYYNEETETVSKVQEITAIENIWGTALSEYYFVYYTRDGSGKFDIFIYHREDPDDSFSLSWDQQLLDEGGGGNILMDLYEDILVIAPAGSNKVYIYKLQDGQFGPSLIVPMDWYWPSENFDIRISGRNVVALDKVGEQISYFEIDDDRFTS